MKDVGALIRIVEHNVVILVNSEFRRNITGIDIVLEAEERCINIQLRELGRMDSSLQVADAQNMSLFTLGDGIGGTEYIRRIKQYHFRGHAKTDGVVHMAR